METSRWRGSQGIPWVPSCPYALTERDRLDRPSARDFAPELSAMGDLGVRCRIANHTVWCARPVGHPVATINTDSPEHLVEEIGEQEQEALQRPE